MNKLIILGILLCLFLLSGCDIERYLRGDHLESIELLEEEIEEGKWVERYNGSQTIELECQPFDYHDWEIVHNKLTIEIPDYYKEEINNQRIISIREPYNCIFNCPTNSSLNGCEYGTCYRDGDKDCIKKRDGEIWNECDYELVVKIRYDYIEYKWEE